MISRQRKWQLKQIAAGLCAICAGKLKHYKERCDRCAVKARLSKRRANGWASKRDGGVGRPQIVSDNQLKG